MPFHVLALAIDVEAEWVEVSLQSADSEYSEAEAIAAGWALIAACSPIEHVIIDVTDPPLSASVDTALLN